MQIEKLEKTTTIDHMRKNAEDRSKDKDQEAKKKATQ